jgi:dTDP-glucose pyrophosphorylase
VKAIILAAGKGTRMRELTEELPKPMLPVRGRPILEHIIEGLTQSGIREICIITGWRADVIEKHFGDGSRIGASIQYARQEVQDGTGRAPEYARGFIGESDFLLTYGDILVRPDTYARLLERFREGALAGVMSVTVGEDITKGGLAFFDEDFRLVRLVEKPSLAQIEELRTEGLLRPGQPMYYNAGIYIFSPLLFEFTPRLQKSPRGEYELTDALSQVLAEGHSIAGLEIAGRWVDVRDPEVLARLESGEGE